MSEEHLSKKEQLEQKRKEKEATKMATEKGEQMKKMGFAIGIVALVVVIVAAIAFLSPSASEVGGDSADPTIGPEDAPVLVQEYSDFQCPACQAAYPVVKDILEEYGDQVRFEYNDFPLPQHEYAVDAAIGAQCALDQGNFFGYHDMLFENQQTWSQVNTAEEAQEYFREYATKLGFDADAFETCVTDQAIADRVNEDISEARALRVNSTPSFFVNGEAVSIRESVSVGLREAIDAALHNESAQ